MSWKRIAVGSLFLLATVVPCALEGSNGGGPPPPGAWTIDSPGENFTAQRNTNVACEGQAGENNHTWRVDITQYKESNGIILYNYSMSVSGTSTNSHWGSGTVSKPTSEGWAVDVAHVKLYDVTSDELKKERDISFTAS